MRDRFLAFAGCVVVLGALGTAACSSLLAPKSPKLTRFECQARALQPALGDVFDTEALLRDLYAGKADLGQALQSAHATADEVNALLNALHACEAPAAPPPAIDPGAPS